MFNLIWISKIWYMLEYSFSPIHISLYKDTQREKGPYSEFFWSLFIRMRENTDQKNSEYGNFSRSYSVCNSAFTRENMGHKNSNSDIIYAANEKDKWMINLLQPSDKIEIKKELIREITRLILENSYIVFWRKKR